VGGPNPRPRGLISGTTVAPEPHIVTTLLSVPTDALSSGRRHWADAGPEPEGVGGVRGREQRQPGPREVGLQERREDERKKKLAADLARQDLKNTIIGVTHEVIDAIEGGEEETI